MSPLSPALSPCDFTFFRFPCVILRFFQQILSVSAGRARHLPLRPGLSTAGLAAPRRPQLLIPSRFPWRRLLRDFVRSIWRNPRAVTSSYFPLGAHGAFWDARLAFSSASNPSEKQSVKEKRENTHIGSPLGWVFFPLRQRGASAPCSHAPGEPLSWAADHGGPGHPPSWSPTFPRARGAREGCGWWLKWGWGGPLGLIKAN